MTKESSNTPAMEPSPLKSPLVDIADALHPGDSLETAGKRMRAHHATEWPVTEGSTIVGIVDRENPDWQVGGHGHDPKSSTVSEIMSSDPFFCFEDEGPDTALRLMEEHGLEFVPVVDREMRTVGIFSREEIAAKAEAVRE